jgi:hypothetical protein
LVVVVVVITIQQAHCHTKLVVLVVVEVVHQLLIQIMVAPELPAKVMLVEIQTLMVIHFPDRAAAVQVRRVIHLLMDLLLAQVALVCNIQLRARQLITLAVVVLVTGIMEREPPLVVLGAGARVAVVRALLEPLIQEVAAVRQGAMALAARQVDQVLLLSNMQTHILPHLLPQALLQSQYLVGIVFTNSLHPAQLHSKITP